MYSPDRRHDMRFFYSKDYALLECMDFDCWTVSLLKFIMRPSSLGGGRILRRTLSVRLSVRLSFRPVIVTERHVAPPSELQ